MSNREYEDSHLCGVIHKTTQLDKARGHLGTVEQEKAETTIFMSSTDRTVKNAPIEVRQEDSRGSPFDLDLDTLLPRECDYQINNSGIF